LNHSLLSTYYFFSYMLYNSKWIENFHACSQLDLKNESKELQPFWTFFRTNVAFWSAAAWLFAGIKKRFLSLQTLISCNLLSGNFWNFFHIFSNQCTKRSYGYICLKMFFFLKFGSCPRNDNFGVFWWKHRQKPLGINYVLSFALVSLGYVHF